MCFDVLASDVRYKLLKPVPLAVEHKAAFKCVRATPKLFRAKENSEFKRHVEARQLIVGIESCARNIMNAKG